VLDPNLLTIGFARRFTEYKRPNLLLRDPERLERLLLNSRLPVQIVVAGKAHPADFDGKTIIRAWIAVARQPRFRRRVVFLEDYDIALAKELVHGVDVWINTPRRPWEACGTSGMKVARQRRTELLHSRRAGGTRRSSRRRMGDWRRAGRRGGRSRWPRREQPL